jgi:hypothetical protein
MKKGRFSEEQIIGILKQPRSRAEGAGTGQRDRRERSDGLHLEVEVRRHGGERRAAS